LKLRKAIPDDADRLADIHATSRAAAMPLGFIAITDKWLHHLYIDPAYADQGIGTGLLHSAMARRKELRLWVFQRNTRARAFYAANGFLELELTDGEANEEKMPDVLMHWRAR